MTSPDDTAVSAANLGFYRALEARDLSAMDVVWAHEDAATCVHPGWHRLEGWTEIRRSFENIFTNSRPWTVSCRDVRVAVVGDLAWVTCAEVIIPFGGDEDEDAARMQATNLFVRTDGEWKMIHHHASSSPTEGSEEEEPVN
ncbi:MAG TPA: nuclear transport factor 2 family protein [Thermoanaerobaculia bacterium]|nr:nuclear transport factor 2 family protein [Thermoanaerobaculia bacterium]